jgi:membrane protease YdiL (CAAX protease family)
MEGWLPSDPPAVRAVALLHQEGALAVVAVAGLAFREGGPVAPLLPAGSWIESIAAGIGVGFVVGVLLWTARFLAPMRQLQRFQSRLVRDWSIADALAVALLSGLAEEALLRALLQPLIGLLPAAALFAVLHLVPDRRLWLWPVVALAMGVVLGLLYERFGYPAAAAAHILLNALALLHLRRLPEE